MAGTQLSRSTSAWNQVQILRTPRGPIEVARAGSGPCVLVIHGTPGSFRQCFSLAEDLGDRYLVVAPSRPGFGQTPLATGRTYVEQAASYAAILDELGVDRAAVVGASGGGPSAVSFAQEFADRCSALVLACAMVPSLIAVPPMLRFVLGPRGVGEVASLLDRRVAAMRLARPAAIDRWMEKSLTADERKRAAEDPRLREDLVAFAYSHLDAPAGLAGIRNDLAQARAAKTSAPQAFSVTAPTLVLHGDADDVVPFSHAEHHRRMIPGAELENYAGAAHAFFFTRRVEVAERLRRFFGTAIEDAS